MKRTSSLFCLLIVAGADLHAAQIESDALGQQEVTIQAAAANSDFSYNIEFSDLVNLVFSRQTNDSALPVEVSNIGILYDSNNDPNAFSRILGSTP